MREKYKTADDCVLFQQWWWYLVQGPNGHEVTNVMQVSCTPDCLGFGFDGSLPSLPVDSLAIEEGPTRYILAGTAAGVYYTTLNFLQEWLPWGKGLPHTPVKFLDINCAAQKLHAATFGRGIWEVDLPCPQ